MSESRQEHPIYQILQEKSEFFCPAKWTELFLYLNHGNSNSCNHPIPHQIPEELLNDPYVLHNTPHKLKMQKLMMQGQRVEECHMCWHMEDADPNVMSDRMIKGMQWQKYIKDLEPKSNHVPKFIEVVFDNLCNLKCSYCDPGQSSSWATTVSQNPILLQTDYRNLYSAIHIKSGKVKDRYYQAWLKWWPMIKDRVEILKISGGEPLISPYFWQWLEITKQSPQIKFVINSNLMVDRKRLDDFMSRSKDFKSIRIAASIDGIGPIAEYSRQGLDCELFLQNVYHWCDHSSDNCYLNLQSTFNLFSIWTLPSWIQTCADLRCKYGNKIMVSYATIVRFPEFQNILLLPENFRQSIYNESRQVLDRVRQYLDQQEIFYIEKILTYLVSRSKPLKDISHESLLQDLSKFIEAYDRTSTKKFREIFNEKFVEWIDYIKI